MGEYRIDNPGAAPTGSNGIGINLGDNAANQPYLAVAYDYPPQTVSATPTSGNIMASMWQTVTGTYRDPDSYADIGEVRWLAAYGLDGAHACYATVWRASNTATLYTDDGLSFLASYALGSANTVSNSQCDLDLSQSSMSCAGTDCSISLRIRFKPTFSYGGWVKHTYTHVYDASWAAGGWTDFGVWTLVAGGPKVIVVAQ